MNLNSDLSSIYIDSEDCKDKYPSPICFFAKIPSDVRVLHQSESAYFELQGCYHEMGHAVHATSVDPAIDYWDKCCISMAIAEMFSFFLERLAKDKNYLLYLEIDDRTVLDELDDRNRFMELFFLTFYAASYLMKTEFCQRHLDIEHTSELYANLLQRYTGLEVPAVRAAELEKRVKDAYGDKWWRTKESGKFLRTHAPGASIKLDQFSALNGDAYLKQIGA